MENSFIFFKKSTVRQRKSTGGLQNGGFSAVFSSFSSASAGTCILFNNNFEFQILKQLSDPEGRFVIADVKTEGKILTLANIYVPNEDNPTFFKNVLNQLISFDCGEIVLGGDYNLILHVEKDKIGGTRQLIKIR